MSYTVVPYNDCLNLLCAAHSHYEIYTEKRGVNIIERRSIIISKDIENLKLGEYDFSEPTLSKKPLCKLSNKESIPYLINFFKTNSFDPFLYQHEKFKLIYESYYDDFSKKFDLYVEVVLGLKDFILAVFPEAKLKFKKKPKSSEVILKIKSLGKPLE